LQDGGHILSQKFKRQKGDKYHMPGQGRALDGAEGARVFQQFKQYATPFMALMPLNRDTKAHLRAHYLQLYVDAGGVLVVVVQFLCTCNLFVSRLVQESRSSKKCRR
jgi:hypothetical protein